MSLWEWQVEQARGGNYLSAIGVLRLIRDELRGEGLSPCHRDYLDECLSSIVDANETPADAFHLKLPRGRQPQAMTGFKQSAAYVMVLELMASGMTLNEASHQASERLQEEFGVVLAPETCEKYYKQLR